MGRTVFRSAKHRLDASPPERQPLDHFLMTHPKNKKNNKKLAQQSFVQDQSTMPHAAFFFRPPRVLFFGSSISSSLELSCLALDLLPSFSFSTRLTISRRKSHCSSVSTTCLSIDAVTLFEPLSLATSALFVTSCIIKSSRALPTAIGVCCATLPTSSSACIIRLILAVGNLVRTGDGSIAGAAGGAALRGGIFVSNGAAPNVEVRSKPPAAVSGV